MNESKKFRSSVGGFNKQDVNTYIIEVNRRFAESKEEFETQKSSLDAKAQELEAQNASLSEKLENSDAELSRVKENFEAVEEKLKAAEDEIASLKRQLELKNTSPEREKDADLRDSEIRKAELYDRISSQVGDIMINASKNAEDIIRRAEETAEKLISDGEFQVNSSKERMRDVMKTVIDDLNGDMQSNTEACIREFRSYVEDITSSSRVLIEELEKKYTNMKGKITYYQSKLEADAGEHLKKLDAESSENLKEFDLEPVEAQ